MKHMTIRELLELQASMEQENRKRIREHIEQMKGEHQDENNV